jgi:hypothetical protein
VRCILLLKEHAEYFMAGRMMINTTKTGKLANKING